MSRYSTLAVVVLVLLATTVATAAPTVVETEPLLPQDQRAKFRLPPGFEIQLVAAEPEIQKPMNMAFDARGRLWVTHSVEYPFAAAAGATPRDGLTVLEDFGSDGRARKATRFADGLNIPIGVLPLPCSDPAGRGQEVIVWSIPHIWKLTDTDGDGRGDRREVLYGPFGFEDTHGNQNSFRLAADGWVYANHGFKNHSRVKLRGEGAEVLELKSGNGYRFRPDGTAIEQVSWGQVNPFGMDIDALGNRFNADCHSRPLTMLLRGGRYPSFFAAKSTDYDDGLGPAPETTADGHGSTGICAVAICDTPRMPAAFQGSVFIGNVVTNVVHRDVVTWRGSSPWVEKPEEFLACDDWWFRPVDLAIGPDGGLYIADFYNCIIGHYEVDLKHPRRDRTRGRIWRVVWKEAPASSSLSDLTSLPARDLAALLDAPAEAVRRLAFDELILRVRTDASIPSLLRDPAAGEHRRARAVRALGLLGQLDEPTISAAVADGSRLVRVHLVKAVEPLPGRDPAHDRVLRGRLTDPDPFVRRAAAEALVTRPAIDAVPELLAAVRACAPDDTQLAHALRRAVAAALREAGPEKLALASIPQADRGTLLDIVAGVPGRPLVTFAVALARQGETTPAVVTRICRTASRETDAGLLDETVSFARTACGTDIEQTAAAVQAMLDGRRDSGQQVAGAGALAEWARGLLDAIAALPAATRPSDMALRAAVGIADRLAVKERMNLVLSVVSDPSRSIDLRREAAATALVLDRDSGVAAIVARLADHQEPVAVRVEFVKQLATIDLPQVREAIAAAVSTAPAAQQRSLVLAAIADRKAAEQVLGLVERGKVSARILQDQQIARRLRDAGAADAEQRIAGLTRGLPSADERVRGIVEQVVQKAASGAGSATAGKAVFAKNCAACHRYGGEGGLIGPQLDGVANRGSERLLEDILDPNRNVDAAFRTTVATLADGRIVAGLRIRDDGADVVFADTAGREVRVPRTAIEETTVTPLSPMPANMADQVDEAALLDLISYLRSTVAK